MFIILSFSLSGCFFFGDDNGDDDNPPAPTGHNAGANCLECHPGFKAAGTVYKDDSASDLQANASVSLTKPDGGEIILESTASNGNFSASSVPDGVYIMHIASVSSRHWHKIPEHSAERC